MAKRSHYDHDFGDVDYWDGVEAGSGALWGGALGGAGSLLGGAFGLGILGKGAKGV